MAENKILLRAVTGHNYAKPVEPLGDWIEIDTVKLDIRHNYGADNRTCKAIIFPVSNTRQREYVRLLENLAPIKFGLELQVMQSEDYYFLMGCHDITLQHEENMGIHVFDWVTIEFRELYTEKM